MSATATPRARRAATQLPGFSLTMGFTWIYLSALVLLPLSWLILRASSVSMADAARIIAQPRTVAALQLSLFCSLCAASLNVIFGSALGWVLARYDFRGRALLDGIVELPFALPTSVAGITLSFLYSENGWFGKWLAHWDLEPAFKPTGIILAMMFVGLPFVVRTVQPVVAEMEVDIEEAADSLGANTWQTFWRVQFPPLLPAIAAGFALALARALGEYGSVLFISGNLPFKTEIAPLLIVAKLEQFDYDGAAVLSSALLLVSLLMLVAVQLLERWTGERFAGRRKSS